MLLRLDPVAEGGRRICRYMDKKGEGEFLGANEELSNEPAKARL